MAQQKLLFITGVGRSGTSLLQSMLNAHPEVNIPPETHFFKRYILPNLQKNQWPKPAQLRDDKYIKRLPEASRNQLITSLSGECGDLAMAFTSFLAGDGPHAVIGDKDTEYMRYLPHLKKVYPDAFLLHIKRDPRDVIASRKKAEWSKNRSVAFHAAEYQYYIKKLSREGPQLFTNRYLELRYEDLLFDPQDTLEPVLAMLGLDFSKKILEFQESSKKLVAQDEKAWKQNLNKPLLKNNFNKWVEELSENEVGIIQSGLEDYFQANNYTLSSAQARYGAIVKRELIKGLFIAKTYNERLRQ